jgi:hypothetical protein
MAANGLPRRLLPLALAFALAGLAACDRASAPTAGSGHATATTTVAKPESYAEQHLRDFVSVPLTADLSGYDAQDRQMLALLVLAAQTMDGLYWQQNGFERDAFLAGISDPATRELAELNFGPWDRLNGDQSFIEGQGARPPGVGFYPADMSKEEFEKADLPGKDGWYSLLRRGEDGKLKLVPFHEAYKPDLEKAAPCCARRRRCRRTRPSATTCACAPTRC